MNIHNGMSIRHYKLSVSVASIKYHCIMCACYEFVQVIPVISILLIVAWTYYVYVYELCVLVVGDQFKMIAYLCVYHLLLIPFLIMYFITMFHKQWYVPANYYLPRDFYEKMNMTPSEDAEYSMLVSFCKARNIRVYTRNVSGGIRVCHTCRLLKPDRAHHCSTCEACVIKMDHHCPWVNNCIGFTNYKYFLMVVLYGGILCTYYFATTLEYSIVCFSNGFTHLRQLNIVISCVVVMALGIALWCLLGFHINLILHNETTVEALHPPTFASAIIFGFDHGKRDNFREMCGMNCFCWFLPIKTQQGDGVTFDVMRYA